MSLTIQEMRNNPVSQKVPKTKEDLTGRKFGHYTVLYYCGRIDKKYYWYCQCDCGTSKVVEQWALTSGTVLSCGCYHKQKVSQSVALDLVGQIFGKLKVVKRLPNTPHRQSYFLCQCECGNTIKVIGSSLKNGHTTSCGCNKSKGELVINHFLSINNIPFVSQKTFDECRDKIALRFDYQIFLKNGEFVLCEYQGEQHYHPVNFNNELDNARIEQNYQDYVRRDNIKREFCASHNIKLIEIPYWDFDNITTILSKELFL